MIPSVPRATIHISRNPNFAPALTLKTSSPISTNPPIAVRIPRKISSIFFTCGSLFLLETIFNVLRFRSQPDQIFSHRDVAALRLFQCGMEALGDIDQPEPFLFVFWLFGKTIELLGRVVDLFQE